MYGDDGPDDDYMTTEQALDAGWLDPDSVEELTGLLDKLGPLVPVPGDRNVAFAILVENQLRTPPPVEGGSDWDIYVSWARVLLGLD